jgi:hypothetical protein
VARPRVHCLTQRDRSRAPRGPGTDAQLNSRTVIQSVFAVLLILVILAVGSTGVLVLSRLVRGPVAPPAATPAEAAASDGPGAPSAGAPGAATAGRPRTPGALA